MQYADAMYNICCRMLQDNVEAEDALQEAFIKVFDNINKYRNESSIGSWIKQIVINTCLTILRKKKKIQFDEFNEQIDVAENEIEEDENYTITTTAIKTAIVQLPTGYSIVFNLFMFENYTHKQIAETLNITESTAKTQLYKAKRKLKDILLQQHKHL